MELNRERRFTSLEQVSALLAQAQGKSFRELDETSRAEAGGKGVLGNIVEESVLHYPVNSDKQADIQVGDDRYEIKVTPLKHVGKGRRIRTVAKERLVLDVINYMTLPGESFEESSFWLKSRNLIIVYYVDDRTDKARQKAVDCRITTSFILDYHMEDLAVIRHDWEFIRAKVAAGHADTLSESDTDYLAACTKGANSLSMRDAPAPHGYLTPTIRAKQRAFSYKSSYMTAIADRVLGERLFSLPLGPDQSLMGYVRQRIGGFVGMPISHIAERLGTDLLQAKQMHQALAMAMLGAPHRDSVESIDQFRKANVTAIKTMVLYPNDSYPTGMAKENMSFRLITEEEWNGLADSHARWEDSFLYSFFEENRFLFLCFQSPVPYKKHHAEDDVLTDGFLWNMPEEDIQNYVRPVWEYLHTLMMSGESVRYGRGTNRLPGAEFNKVLHLRPHGKNAADTVLLPNGEHITKQGFWLDRRYLARVVAEHAGH